MKKTKLVILVFGFVIIGMGIIYDQKLIGSRTLAEKKPMPQEEKKKEENKEKKTDPSTPLAGVPTPNQRTPASVAAARAHVAAPTTESENEPNRLPEAPKEWNELPDETVEYVKKYGDEILDTHIAFTGHSTPWKRSILVRSSKSKHDPITIQIEEKLDSNGKVVGRVSMVGGHLLVSVKQNHTIEEVLERVPNAVLTQSTKLTNTHLVQFEAQDAKKLDEMLQSFSDQKDLVERAVPNILFHLK